MLMRVFDCFAMRSFPPCSALTQDHPDFNQTANVYARRR